MEALGDLEELAVTLHDDPPRIDRAALGVTDKNVEHLGHTAADLRRAHVPHRGLAEGFTRLGYGTHQVVQALRPDEGGQTHHVQGRNLHVLGLEHSAIVADGRPLLVDHAAPAKSTKPDEIERGPR